MTCTVCLVVIASLMIVDFATKWTFWFINRRNHAKMLKNLMSTGGMLLVPQSQQQSQKAPATEGVN